jgi:hypothetical protein
VTIYQVGECSHTSEGKPRDLALQWTVSGDGLVAFEEADTKRWSGTVHANLAVALEKTFDVTCQGTPRTGTAIYEGQIEQEEEVYRLDMEAVEDWCPPTCRFRLVYALVRKR